MARTKETLRLLEELRRQGFTYKVTTKQHYMVYSPEDQLVTTLSGTASDHRSFHNAIAQLRKVGFKWRR